MSEPQTIERKCQNCGHWNKGRSTSCSNCGFTIDPHQRIVEEHEDRQKKRLEVPKTPLDTLLERIHESENPLVKGAYFFLKGIWFIYWVILSFFLWLIAATPG